jgi:CRISPR-associated protein Cas2
MYVIVVYDVWDKKTNKIHKYLKKRLHWIQNSVFEGELSKSEFIKMKWELKKMIKQFEKENKEIENSIIIFSMPYKWVLEKEIIWIEKNGLDNFV